uniref:SnoaL-like domain-containing protein n=1 Tax=uncultured Nocardioidaceae bacterium TaxID=253824 RepID=A0A6J4MLF5_9ACTN|nr:MAG: hypothetical protein AVDCRST_MAG46-3471 [uncultured Nocardioidaceae bacterium]
MLLRMSLARRTRARAVSSCVAFLASLVLGSCASDATPEGARPATPPVGDVLEVLPEAPTGDAAPRRTGWTCTAVCQRWRPVLDRLDGHRTRAYASGRPRQLRRVYAPGSRVLAHDLRMLRAWTRRGATVSGVRLRVLAATRQDGSSGVVRLGVVDRLLDATARLADGATVPLPHDRVTERVVVLRRVRGQWRIAGSR